MASIFKALLCAAALAALILISGCASKTRIAVVSHTGGVSTTPVIGAPETSDPSELYIAWVNQQGTADPEVYFRWVHVRTSPMGSPIALGPAVAAQLSGLDMAVSGRNIYVAIHHWPAGTPNSFEAFLAASADSGRTFRSAVNVSNSPTAHSYFPRVTARGTQVFLSWLEQTATPGMYEVRVRESTDGGQNFGSVDILTSAAANASPHIAISGPEVYVAYCESPGISLVRRRNLAGGAWQAPERLTSASGTSICGLEALATDGRQSNSAVHAVWVEAGAGGRHSLFVKRSLDGGPLTDAGSLQSIWSSPISSVQAVSNYGDNVQITYVGLTDPNFGHQAAFFARTETPTTLSAPRDLSGSTLENPRAVAMSPGGEYTGITWSTAINSHIVLSEPYYVGNREATPVRLRDQNGSSLQGLFPDVLRRVKDVYVVWRNQATSQIMLYSRRGWRWSGQ